MATAPTTPTTAPSHTLQETVTAVHFQAPLPLSVMDLADWVRHFSDYPIVQQIQSLPSAGIGVAAAFQFGPGDGLPRMLLRTADGRFSLQLQSDRFAMGWNRIEPIGAPADYPGFECMIARWDALLLRFEQWTQDRFHLKPEYRLAELVYVNAAPLERDGRALRISEIFRFVQPARPVSFFNVSWGESLDPERDRTEGRLTGNVTVNVSLSQAPPVGNVLAFTFGGLAEVAPGQESNHILNNLHAKIRQIYQSAIISDAL